MHLGGEITCSPCVIPPPPHLEKLFIAYRHLSHTPFIYTSSGGPPEVVPDKSPGETRGDRAIKTRGKVPCILPRQNSNRCTLASYPP